MSTFLNYQFLRCCRVLELLGNTSKYVTNAGESVEGRQFSAHMGMEQSQTPDEVIAVFPEGGAGRTDIAEKYVGQTATSHDDLFLAAKRTVRSSNMFTPIQAGGGGWESAQPKDLCSKTG